MGIGVFCRNKYVGIVLFFWQTSRGAKICPVEVKLSSSKSHARLMGSAVFIRPGDRGAIVNKMENSLNTNESMRKRRGRLVSSRTNGDFPWLYSKCFISLPQKT